VKSTCVNPKAAPAAEAPSSPGAAAVVAAAGDVAVFAAAAAGEMFAAEGRALSAAAAVAVAAAVPSDGAGFAAPAGTAAVAAPRQVVASDRGPRGQTQFPVPRGRSSGQGPACVFPGCMPGKAGPLGQDPVCDPEEGAFESGGVCVPQGRVLH
jgi:hypothetical protein